MPCPQSLYYPARPERKRCPGLYMLSQQSSIRPFNGISTEVGVSGQSKAWHARTNIPQLV